MEAISSDNYSGKPLDHFGLIADKIDDLNIIPFIDERLPLSEGCGVKVSMGERVAAMIYNGLGFIDTRLYMFPEFLDKKPVNRLFGRELDPHWFNDDSIGRCLDAIVDYGTTKLFTELSFSIGKKKNLLGRSAHFDSSTLQLYGEYAGYEEEKKTTTNSPEPAPIPARGYSKSHRHDLKQMVINLATTGKANFPIWMESHSGNASDKKILPDAAARMHEFCKGFKNIPDFLYVGDSAIYSNILPYSNDMKWLTRVPENILPAKQLLLKEEHELSWNALSEGYSYHVSLSEYGSVKQRWILIFSEQSYKREVKTLERTIAKEKDTLEKAWWHLSNELFSCPEDAVVAGKKLNKKMKYHQVNYNVAKITGHTKAGRPSKDAEQQLKGYKIEFNLSQDIDKINKAKRKKGRFILSTNELNKEILPDTEVLSEYKRQSGTELGFKFIKDKTFEIDSVFLKKPGRIDALMMVMTLCLMVYGVSQYDLRKSLQSSGKTVPDQNRKPTNKPSLKWIYFLFSGVHELTVSLGESSRQLVINVNSVLKDIVGHFGTRASEIYLNPA